jgi:hypothetical protein
MRSHAEVRAISLLILNPFHLVLTAQESARRNVPISLSFPHFGGNYNVVSLESARVAIKGAKWRKCTHAVGALTLRLAWPVDQPPPNVHNTFPPGGHSQFLHSNMRVLLFALPMTHSRRQSIRSHLNISSARDPMKKYTIFSQVCGHGLQFCRRKRPLLINMQSKDTQRSSNSLFHILYSKMYFLLVFIYNSYTFWTSTEIYSRWKEF